MYGMPCTNRNHLSNGAGHLAAAGQYLPFANKMVTLAILAVTLSIVMNIVMAANADGATFVPVEQAEPGTTHGVTLPGVVELTGNAAQPQHPLAGPPGVTAAVSIGNPALAPANRNADGVQGVANTLDVDKQLWSFTGSRAILLAHVQAEMCQLGSDTKTASNAEAR